MTGTEAGQNRSSMAGNKGAFFLKMRPLGISSEELGDVPLLIRKEDEVE